MKSVDDIIKEATKKTNVALSKIQQQIETATLLYEKLMGKLNTYSEDDRTRCQKVYDKIFEVVNSLDKPSAGVLDSLNAASANMLSSTQRQRELLQEVGKTRVKLEEIQTLMNEEKIEENPEVEFNVNDCIN